MWGEPISRDEFHAAMSKFPSRIVSRTGICEPPVEQYRDGDRLIGSIWLNDAMGDGQPRVYRLAKDLEGM